MTDPEFKMQVFKEPKQWQSGLYVKLQMPESGGVVLPGLPAVSRWIDLDGIGRPACLATDECCQLYLVNADDCRLHRYDPAAGRMERMACFGGRGHDPGLFSHPVRMAFGRHILWFVDSGNGRIQGFARENLQLVCLIDNLPEPVDMAVDGAGQLFVLDRASRRIQLYDSDGHSRNTSFGADHLQEPLGCAMGKENILFVIDSACNGFLRFQRDGNYLGTVGDFSKVVAGFRPSVLCIDGSGKIYVGDETVGGLHQFAADGSYLGPLSGFDGPVMALAVDGRSTIYASGIHGLAVLSPGQGYGHEEGLYYSKSLDSGIEGCQWHRLALQTDLPTKTALDVYYHASDDPGLKDEIDSILTDKARSIQQKRKEIDGLIPETAWIGPERDPADMLFREKTGRYLWLKLALVTFDEAVTPSIAAMRVYYPRNSYLRYLPAIYQEDPASREFLERFLSLFESVFFDLETEITALFRYYDPATTPTDFLPWLASWLNLALEEEWPEAKKRLLIGEAYRLYRLKGTPAGISRLVEIYTGKAPRILEHAHMGTPMVLGKDFRLGTSSFLIGTPIRGFRLGDDSILGRVALRDEAYLPADPFLPLAQRFSLILNLSEEEFAGFRQGLVRLLDAEKPADSSYRLQIVSQLQGGAGAYVGITSRVDGGRAMKIGLDSILGTSLIVYDNEHSCGKVDRRAVVGTSTKLI